GVPVEELAVEGLVVTPKPPYPSADEPGEGTKTVVGSEQPAERPALRGGHPLPASLSQDRGEKQLLVPVVVVDDPRAAGRIAQPLHQMPADRAGSLVCPRVSDHGAPVLHVVVEGIVDVGDLAARESDDREPVVMERSGELGREGERVLE